MTSEILKVPQKADCLNILVALFAESQIWPKLAGLYLLNFIKKEHYLTSKHQIIM